MRGLYKNIIRDVYRQVGPKPFTFSEVRGTIQPLYPVNGAVMMNIVSEKLLVLGADRRLKGGKRVHQYKISPLGMKYVERAACDAGAPVAVAC